MNDLMFSDEMKLQVMPLNQEETEELIGILEIDSVCKGSRREDTCIAEIRIE